MKQIKKDVPTSVRIPKEVKKALQKQADKEGRPLGNMIVKIITDFLSKHN